MLTTTLSNKTYTQGCCFYTCLCSIQLKKYDNDKYNIKLSNIIVVYVILKFSI